MSEIDYGRMLKMAEFITKYQQRREAAGDENVSSCASALDKRLNTPELATIKSAIPYLEPRNQKLVGLMVKLIEIQRLLNYLKETAEAVNRINAEGDNWQFAMLELIKPHLPKSSQDSLDSIMTFMEFANALQD